jgi:hypothetical protein
MPTTETFQANLKQLLTGFPDSFTLPQCQYFYSKVIVELGLNILDRFSADLIGQIPYPTASGGEGGGGRPGPAPGGGGAPPIIQPNTQGGGEGGGGRPSCIILAGLALGLRDSADQNAGKKVT